MPYIDYYLTSDIDLTKKMISEGLPRSLTPTLKLGNDKRQWNKSQLKALRLILCNIMAEGHRDNGVFLYSRKKKTIPRRFNPEEIGYSSLITVINKLSAAGIIKGVPAPPRKKGEPKPNLTSQFTITKQVLDFAGSLGINPDTVKNESKFHVRLRDRDTNENLEFEYDEYTRHIEVMMGQYCDYLNQQDIMLSTWNYEEEGFIHYGKIGQRIHLYRNYRNHYDYEKTKQDIDNLWIEMDNYNFNFGGRSGGYWQGFQSEERPWILINGNKVNKADFPASHINLCYLSEKLGWYQQETYEDLVEQDIEGTDAYYLTPNLHRDLVKKMVQLMFNIKGRRAVSQQYGKWLKGTNKDKNNRATPEQVVAYKKSRLSNIEIMDMIEMKHHRIRDYFYKGKIAGQIIQFEEANMIHHLAVAFAEQHNIAAITVYDELIVEEEYQPMVQDFMYSTGYCEICDKYSLMNQIKNL